MKLDLTEVAQNVGNRQKYTVNEPCWDENGADGLCCVGNITGELEFTNTGRLIIARGDVQAKVELECGRCLTKFEMPVEAKIEELFEIPDYSTGQPEVEEEKIELADEQLFVDNKLDLSEMIRQILLLVLPIKPLCDEACKGLCQQCGQNLNVAKCDCAEVVESPFVGLAELLKTEEIDSTEG